MLKAVSSVWQWQLGRIIKKEKKEEEEETLKISQLRLA